jgi:hypothetical protein
LNFLPEVRSARDFVVNSLDILQQECPQAYALLYQQLAGKTLLLEIGQERMHLVLKSGQIAVRAVDKTRQPAAALYAGWGTILDLADARLTLSEAILNEDVNIVGEVNELARLYEAILLYIRGGMRCPSFPLLLDDFRKAYHRYPEMQ